MSAIGSGGAHVDATTPTPADRELIAATAQGLVRFDAAGQIEGGLAERWTVLDDGRTYIFRLRSARWSDGAAITADQVATLLRRHIGQASRNPLARFLTAVESIVVMTPEVIEVRLTRPRPDLLKLFAQPELGLIRGRAGVGTGPMRIVASGTSAVLLRPVADPTQIDPDEPQRLRPEDDVRLIGERAAQAIARFAAHQSDLVTGGSYLDRPLLNAGADVAPTNIRLDPAAGLFGLAIVSRDGFLAEPARRAAIAEAIDASAVLGAVDPNWSPVASLLPDGSDSSAPPSAPSWAPLAQADRVAEARAQITAWQGGPVTLRIALPAGPGATLVYGAVAASLARIGVIAERVGLRDPAELRLIDAVAPYDSARWYLAIACQPCGEAAQAALDAARDAPTLAERSARIAVADQAIAEDVPFIPLGRPLRWSLVALRLRQWQPNARAAHPLNHLRADPT